MMVMVMVMVMMHLTSLAANFLLHPITSGGEYVHSNCGSDPVWGLVPVWTVGKGYKWGPCQLCKNSCL